MVANHVITLLNNYCWLNDVNIYFNNYVPLYKDVYLKEYFRCNALNLKNDLSKLEINEMINYLIVNNLTENNIRFNYQSYYKGKELEELCLSEKLMCLQYTLENFKVNKDQLIILINAMEVKLW